MQVPFLVLEHNDLLGQLTCAIRLYFRFSVTSRKMASASSDKVLECVDIYGKFISKLRSVTCHMGLLSIGYNLPPDTDKRVSP